MLSIAPSATRATRATKIGVFGARRTKSLHQCQAVAGKVRNVPAGDFQNLVNEGYIVLDVRPHTEREKAPLVDAVEVPLFVPDEEMSISTLLKKSTAFGMVCVARGV